MNAVSPGGHPVPAGDRGDASPPGAARAATRSTGCCAGCSAWRPRPGSTSTASAFVRAVVDRVGVDGFNAIWTVAADAADARPRSRDPARWIAARPRLTRPDGPVIPPSRRCAVAVARGALGADAGPPVLVACSGGADSLALAAAIALRGRPGRGSRPGLITVDHGLQPGSDEQAAPGRGSRLRPRPRPGRRLVAVEVGHGRRPGGGRPDRALCRAQRRRGRRSARTSCSATPSTTRPRPCCSASAAAPGPGRSRACSARRAATCGRCSTCAERRPRRPARRWDCRCGTTRTTPTRAFQRVRLRREVAAAAGGRPAGRGRRRARPYRRPWCRDDLDALDVAGRKRSAVLAWTPTDWRLPSSPTSHGRSAHGSCAAGRAAPVPVP